jgi:hypothetical protein
LNQLSNTRETQHFAKKSKLNHVEHSTPLQLIRSSEVDPFVPPKKSAVKADEKVKTTAQDVKKEFERNMAKDISPPVCTGINADAPSAQLTTTTQDMTARLDRTSRDIRDLEKEFSALQKEVGTLVKTVGVLICLLVGGATGVSLYYFWPQEKHTRTGGDIGKRLAERTRAAMPLPAARTMGRDVGTQTVSGASIADVMGEAAVLPVAAKAAEVSPVVLVAPGAEDRSRWYQGWFWKRG